MTRIYLLTTAETADHRKWVGEVVDIFREYIERPDTPYASADAPDDADMVLFVEPPSHKMLAYVQAMSRHPVVTAFPEKCFAYDWEDDPVGVLPGVYPSMTQTVLAENAHRCRVSPYVLPYDNIRRDIADYTNDAPPLLFSFRGFNSAPVRRAILDADYGDAPVRIVETFRWLGHNEAERLDFGKDIVDSKFSLCPRGVGVSSHRFYETLALGRAAVVLSDAWESFPGPDWDSFVIRIAEKDALRLVEIITPYAAKWREMGQAARAAFDKWVATDKSPALVLDHLEDIRRSRPASYREADFQKQWNSWDYQWKHGWTLPQGFARRVSDGSLLKRLLNRR